MFHKEKKNYNKLSYKTFFVEENKPEKPSSNPA